MFYDDEEPTKVVNWTGEGSDCDTCGWNYDEAELEVYPSGWVLRTRYGCYDGAFIVNDLGDAWEEIEHIERFSEDTLSEIRNLLQL